MAKKIKKPKGEAIIVSSKKGLEPDFFKALMAFQYGEGEESDAGFEEMKRQAQIPPKKEVGN
ncbi:MAG: hypothetical protein AAB911_02110 [Patescibacteria group bacterium]